MKKNWKSVCVAVMMIAIVGLFWACDGDGNNPAGPSGVTLTPASAPQFNTPTSNPATPTSPTYTDLPELKPKRGNNPFGSGYACEDYPVGVPSVWRENEQGRISKWTVWTIKNTTDQRWRVSGKVFGEKEPGCAATRKGRKGADDILIIEDPEWIEVGETRDVRWRIDMNPMYDEDYLCGRFQFGIGLKPETHGNFWNHTDRVIDTGSDECDPPKKECDDQSTNLTLGFDNPPSQTTTTATLQAYWVRATVNSTQPGTFTFTGKPPQGYPKGQWSKRYGPYRCDAGTLTGTADSECNDDTKTIKIPGCQCVPCQDASVTINATLNGETVNVTVNASHAGTLRAGGTDYSLNPGTNTFQFSLGCGMSLKLEARIYDGSCGERVPCASDRKTVRAPDCEQCVGVDLSGNSSIDGNNLVTASVDDAPGSSATSYKYKRHNMGSASTTTMPWGENFQLSCDESYQVTVRAYDGREECDQIVLTENAEGCSQGVLPGSGSGSGAVPNGNPETQCGHFGLVPGDGGFYITKCGQFYQWGTSHPPPGGQCSNGQDVSHIVECDCPEDD